jgi:N-acetylneuraminic acid mutarotase
MTLAIPDNRTLPITLTATVPGGGEVVYSIESAPTSGTLDGSAPTLIYRPQPGFSGTDSFEFKVSDADGNQSTATVSIVVSLNASVWSRISGLAARYVHATIELDGKLYVFGGYGVNGSVNDLHVYDPATGEWNDLSRPTSGNPPSVRSFHSAVEVGGKMYVFGGYGVGYLNDLHVYDPATREWTDLSTPTSGTAPSARYAHSAVELGGKMYVLGGYAHGGSYLNDLHVYDPATGEWTDLSTPTSGSPPSLLTYHSTVELGGKMYVFGGNNSSNTGHNDLHVYDPATGEWNDLSTPTSGSPPSLRQCNTPQLSWMVRCMFLEDSKLATSH